MKNRNLNILFGLLFLLSNSLLFSQGKDREAATAEGYFVGLAYGVSVALGNFGATDVNDAESGYAQNGRRYDLYGGHFLTDRITLTAGVRYQQFATDVSEVVTFFNELNPGFTFEGENGDWQTYYLLLGAAYKVSLGKRFEIYPRLSLGPLWANSPGFDVQSSDGISQNDFRRGSETGLGIGYDIGIGFRTNLGKRLALLPTFTFSGGSVTLSEVETRLNTITSIRDLNASIQSFNLGLSLAYII